MNIKINSDMRMMFPEETPIIQDLYWTEARIGGGSDLDIVFHGPEGSSIASSAEFLGAVDAFQRRVEEEAANPDSPLRVLTNFDSALAVLRKIHQVQNENSAAFFRVPIESDVAPEARKPTVLFDEVLEEEIIIPGQNASTLIAQYYIHVYIVGACFPAAFGRNGKGAACDRHSGEFRIGLHYIADYFLDHHRNAGGN